MSAKKILKKSGIIIVTVLFFGFFTFASQITDGIREFIKTAVLPDVLVELTNVEREKSALNVLRINSKLVEAAQLKADHMAANSYFSHTGPDGEDLRTFLKAANYDFLYAGENLAVKFNESEAVQKAWMDSQSHRANILGSNFDEIGIATAKGVYKGKETIFVVQMFGKPRLISSTSEINTIDKSVSLYENKDLVTMTRVVSVNDNSEGQADFDLESSAEEEVELNFKDNSDSSFILDFFRSISTLTGVFS